MKKTKTQKGITLIALIITIVVLLILAVVTINAIQGDGIIEYAKNAADEYTKKANEEQEKIDSLLGQIEGSLGGGSSAITLADAQAAAMLDKETNSTTYDIYGNKIVVPAGFKILVDETTGYTENDISVTKGVVIQDKSGNEFVWVPVGTIYTNTDKTESKTITLGRYESFVKNDAGEYVPAQTAENYATKTVIKEYYTEDTAENHDRDNVIAKDIGTFCTNSISNGGYYIGRFEAGKENNTLICKSNKPVYNNVTQSQASSLSQNMYKDATTFTSDLINSYAWDTAIIFIQTFGGCEDYYTQSFSTNYTNTGINNDKYCNIYDMSGNAFEFSTETSSYNQSFTEVLFYPTIARGGGYVDAYGGACRYACDRASGMTDFYSGDGEAFRPVLYMNM